MNELDEKIKDLLQERHNTIPASARGRETWEKAWDVVHPKKDAPKITNHDARYMSERSPERVLSLIESSRYM